MDRPEMSPQDYEMLAGLGKGVLTLLAMLIVVAVYFSIRDQKARERERERSHKLAMERMNLDHQLKMEATRILEQKSVNMDYGELQNSLEAIRTQKEGKG